MSGVFRFDVEDWTKEHEDGEDREIKQSVVQQKQQQEQQQQHVLLNSVSASPPLNAEWKMVDTMEGLALSAPMQRLKSGGQTNGLATAIQRREQMMLPPSLLEIGVAMVIQNVDKLGDLADLPPPVAQKVVDQLVALHELTPSRLYKLRLCAIESLKLEHGHVDWMEIVHKLPLNQLELRQCNGIGDNILKKMVRVGSPWPATMVELHFINCPCVSHNGLAALASLTNLTKLSLVSMDLNNPVLQSFASLSKLQALDLTSCQKISAQGLTGIANMLQLKELNLSNCSRIQGADALLALKKLENLEKLWLRELQLDDKSLVPLRMVNSLKYIDLWGVRQATDQGLTNCLSLMRRLEYLDLTQTKVGPKFVEMLPLLRQNLRVLHITQATSLADGPQRERRLVECFSQLTSLEELSVCNVGWLTNPMIKALEKLPRLRRLSINSCKSLDMTFEALCDIGQGSISFLEARNVNWAEDGMEGIVEHQQLVHLDISHPINLIHGELVAVQHLEKLEHLDVSFCEMDEDDFKAVSSLTNLKLLRMKGISCEGTSFRALSCLQHLTTLTSLNLSQVMLLDEDLQSFLPFLVNLTWLHLKHCELLTSKGMTALVSLSQLEHLNLEGSKGLDDSTLEIVGTLINLTFLDASHIPSITDRGLMSLFNLRRLRELNLLGCPRVSDQAVPSLRYLVSLTYLQLDVSNLSYRGMEELEDLANQLKANVKVKSQLGKGKVIIPDRAQEPRRV